MTSSKEYRATLSRNGCPDPPGAPLKIRFQAGTNDWWVLTKKGWFWLRGSDRTALRPDPNAEWKFAPLGPPGETPPFSVTRSKSSRGT